MNLNPLVLRCLRLLEACGHLRRLGKDKRQEIYDALNDIGWQKHAQHRPDPAD